MAIYHLQAKTISRASGRCVVQAAAYRAAEDLQLDKTGEHFDYTRKQGVEHREIMAPEGAPAWVTDRARLWNGIEAVEKRIDAQLAREIEIALPVELNLAQQVALVREFVGESFVAQGMVADIAIHRDDPGNPHAHILLSMRQLNETGFGPKNREWNSRQQLQVWREAWAEKANQHLARAGIEMSIDHRSHAARGINLEPGQKLGLDVTRREADNLPDYLQERVQRQAMLMRENGERIIAEPQIVTEVMTQQQATFTQRDVARFLHTHTHDAPQFAQALARVMGAPELVALGQDDRGQARYTTHDMLQLESAMLERAGRLAGQAGHAVTEESLSRALAPSGLSEEQAAAARHALADGDLKTVIGVAGSGKSRLLASARQAWEDQGYTVKGAALSGIAAENLQRSAGIASRTLASYELSWNKGRDRLSGKDVLVIDEAGMLGTRQLARVLERAEVAGAKVVLVGDAEQLQPIEAGAPFRAISAAVGTAEITAVRRQHAAWQRQATRDLAAGDTAQALAAYQTRGRVIETGSREEARQSVLAAWDGEHGSERTGAHQGEHNGGAAVMLAYTHDDVRALNEGARARKQARGELQGGQVIVTARGERSFAAGDRVLFLRNENSLGVKNGSLGEVESVDGGRLGVRLDSADEQGGVRRVEVDSRFYEHLDHGYATTIHKSQGATVDRAYVLASAYLDRHATYVALSRHRNEALLVYAREDFATPERLMQTLSRARHKDMALNYATARGYQPGAGEPRREREAGVWERGAAAFQQRYAQFEQRREAAAKQRAAEKARAKTAPERPPLERGRDRER